MPNLAGDSAVAEIPGVFGENSVNGDGVFGQGGSGGRGVVGVSTKHTGVEGTTTDGIAVFGGATGGKGRGVVGVTNATTAVEGNAASGDAVYGVSTSGIGVHGKGGHLGGYFEGAVEITGNLTIQGVSLQLWLQRIAVLEQKAAALEGRVQRLRERPPHQAVTCNVEVDLTGFGDTVEVRIFGGGFLPPEAVDIVEGGQVTATANADAAGRYNVQLGVLKARFPTQHTVHAHGQMSGRTSNDAGFTV